MQKYVEKKENENVDMETLIHTGTLELFHLAQFHKLFIQFSKQRQNHKHIFCSNFLNVFYKTLHTNALIIHKFIMFSFRKHKHAI